MELILNCFRPLNSPAVGPQHTKRAAQIVHGGGGGEISYDLDPLSPAILNNDAFFRAYSANVGGSDNSFRFREKRQANVADVLAKINGNIGR